MINDIVMRMQRLIPKYSLRIYRIVYREHSLEISKFLGTQG